MITQKTPSFNIFYMLLLTTLPILSRYQVGPLDLDVILILICIPFFLLSSSYLTITPLGIPIVLMILYVGIVTIMNLFVGQLFASRGDIVLRTGRYCLYLFIVFCMGNKHVNYEDLMRIYRLVVYISTAYLILQTLVYYTTGIVLPSKIGGSSRETEGGIGRLRSFYSEPAELSYALAPFIGCSLFGKNYKKDTSRGNYIDALVGSVGIILSTSGQGIFCIAMIWGLWLLNRIFKQGMRTRDILLLAGISIAVVVLYTSGILKFALGRAESVGEGSAIDARSSGYVTLTILSPLQKIFGSGFGNYIVENVFDLEVYFRHVYYSSIADLLFCQGILGTLIWGVFFLFLYRKGNTCSRVLILAFLMMSLLGSPMTGKFFPLWFTLICLQLPNQLFVPEANTVEF